jgi:diadenylate cyclase
MDCRLFSVYLCYNIDNAQMTGGGMGMSLLTNIKFTDIIDILIVSYVIYKLIVLVRGTRAVQLVKGILVIVIAWVMSVWLNLYTLKWLLNQMITVGVLAVIVIFQPELRRALEQLGRGRLFSRGSDMDQEYSRIIGEVVKAVHHMAQRKIGALIVFERETGLNDYIESGVKIEGKPTSELLVTIFAPNTPLHDGAVIIKDNKVMAAACYLPLSENPFISKELGTRHRAAIGVTEVSDAICVVVSEETGQVSFSMNGQVVRDIKEESLIAKLFDSLKPQSSKEKSPFWKRKGEARG